MSYNRVIPRDLFNESSLLKCLGRLYICLENTPGHAAELQQVGREFDIRQSDDDGSIYAAGVRLVVRGDHVHLSRPLNPREPWPLWAILPDDDEFGGDEIEVYTGEGELSPEFLTFITGGEA